PRPPLEVRRLGRVGDVRGLAEVLPRAEAEREESGPVDPVSAATLCGGAALAGELPGEHGVAGAGDVRDPVAVPEDEDPRVGVGLPDSAMGLHLDEPG